MALVSHNSVTLTQRLMQALLVSLRGFPAEERGRSLRACPGIGVMIGSEVDPNGRTASNCLATSLYQHLTGRRSQGPQSMVLRVVVQGRLNE